MDVQERCRMIAEFADDETTCGNGECCGIEHEESSMHKWIPRYYESLDATMRAARRLDGVHLYVGDHGLAFIAETPHTRWIEINEDDDPARAAFLCLSDYLAAQHLAGVKK